MPFGSVTLTPGVNVERTPTALRSGYAQTSLIRFRDSLAQKYGGYDLFYQFSVSGVPRDLHAWQDLNVTDWLAVGTTTELDVISNNTLQNITPQKLVSDFAPNISTTINSNVVSIIDPNITNVTVNDSVFFNVPVSQGGLILDGLYPISQINGTHSYDITVNRSATATTTNPTATNNTTAIGNNTLHFGTTPAWVVQGMVIADLTNPAAIPAGTTVASVTGTTVVMSANAASPGVGNGDNIVFSSVPVFTTTNGSSQINVELIAHGVSVGDTVVFEIATTAHGVTIQGSYKVLTVTDANNFSIAVATQATATATFVMNNGNAELVYYIALGPQPVGTGYGLGGYGDGGYGTGSGAGGDQTGSPISATDWTSDNWGEILVACPKNDATYFWEPRTGFQNAQVIASAPPFNTAIFVSMSQQILIAIGSAVKQAIGWQQQPLLVRWSTDGDFLNWTQTSSDQAGDFPIPTGSKLMGGMAVANQNLLWSDLDLWAMPYIGPPDVFGFNKIGAGMGLVSIHAAQQLRGSVFWMGRTNFYSYTSNGAAVLPCPVWDAVFQNINTNFLQNVRAMPNTPFDEAGWLYPSAASANGECDSYVKVNITEPGSPWDYGPLSRSAWIDLNVFGMPIAATPTGVIYQQETTPDAAGQPLLSSFTTGYFYLGEGEDFVAVDQIYPDFKWGTFGGSQNAQVQITFNVTNYPDDAPVSYGPYTVREATEFVSVRFRGRMMSITVSSSDVGSFWRLGACRWRYTKSGRR